MTAWRVAASRLRDAGIASPELDARLLLAHAAGMSHTEVITKAQEELSDDIFKRFEAIIERRLRGEPVSRIVGRRAFWAHDFLVTPDTLDPRPDSETLIELVLRIVEHEAWRNKPISLLDIGTGTGCLLLSLLAELPNARGTGTDISNDALAVAQQNCERMSLQDRATFVETSWAHSVEGQFDIILSNPPYIPTTDMDGLMNEVRLHDPRIALDGGPDGLSAYREIIRDVQRIQHLGWLAFEVGAGQDRDVAILLEAAGYEVGASELTYASDLGGIVRCVAGHV